MYQKYEVTVMHVVKTKAFPCASGQNSLSAEKKNPFRVTFTGNV